MEVPFVHEQGDTGGAYGDAATHAHRPRIAGGRAAIGPEWCLGTG